MENTADKIAMSRLCPACHAEVGDDFTFCNKCGAPLPVQEEKNEKSSGETVENPELEEAQTVYSEPVISEPEEKVCPVCKTSVKGTFRFCNKCGADLSKPHTEESRKEPETKRFYDYSLSASQPSPRFCPACKLSLQPGTAVCPRCGRRIAPARQHTDHASDFRTWSIVLYCLAGFFFLIGFIVMVTGCFTGQSILSTSSTLSALLTLTGCLFSMMTSLILTVLGSTFLFLSYPKRK